MPLVLLLLWAGLAHGAGPKPPLLSVGVSTALEEETYRGWPMVITLDINHPEAALGRVRGQTVQPITLAVPSGRWTRLVKLAIRDSTGEHQAWPLQLRTTVGTTLTLDTTHAGHVLLVLPPEATTGLAPGTYTLQAWLDSREGATDTSWKGWATAETSFELKDAPATLTAEQQCAKALIFSSYHQSTVGGTAQAIAALDAAIALAPDEVECLTARGELADELGNTHEAIDHYRLAIDAVFRLPGDGPVGGGLLSRCRQFVEKLPASERSPVLSCGYVMSCTGETDAQLCSARGSNCGPVTTTDRCGRPRTIDSCGTCTSPRTCGGGGTPNVCGCTPESDAQFCARLGKNCGSVTGIDSCGSSRTVASCGGCTSPQTCGGAGAPNVCGTCAPRTCASVGYVCGTISDGCGNILNCGSCTQGTECGQGTCYPVGSCSDCTPCGPGTEYCLATGQCALAGQCNATES